MQLIYRAGNVTEAEIVKGMLEANGIHAHVGGAYLQGGVGEMATMDFAHVHVPDEECGRAREIIQAYEDKRPQQSAKVGLPTGSKATVVSRLLITLLAAAATGILLYFVVL
jgi:hypothetical protein